MKMKQTFAPCVQPWTEIFYDGQAKVVDNIIEIPENKLYWANELYFRGFVPLEEETTPEVVEPEVETPKAPTRGRKVTNGKDSK